ncbi:plasmid stabilization protein [Flavivirga aquatica]|uniref:Plasmid stabilization protein n=1 Tax=Flavivirga aquatica TaxID=1849968 RepID=A0A1E5TCH9_9FLAO|nr:type II toxin-antitoxin system RelE/ParE family toxin [Flavivirga aquatica]OEK09037.1 plasmid stabilization protein [Flavivirga aquatica]
MKYQIIWSDFSDQQLNEIFDYYSKKVNKRTATKIIQKILSEVIILEKTPFAGQIENTLTDRKISYRYLVCNSYKIIYSIIENEQLIRIADIFDTRQNPTKIEREK